MFRIISRILLAFFLVSALISCVYAQTTQIYSPSSTTTIISGWSNPTYAYSSDDNRTYASSSNDGASQEYSGYGINVPSGATIDNVYVGVEGYTSDSANEDLYVWIYDGASWYSATATDYSSETLQWIDFTSSTSWTPEKVNSIKTKINYDYTGSSSGCYSNQTYFVVVNSTDGTFENTTWKILPVSQINVGTTILAWNKTSWSLQFSTVTDVDVHEGNWTLYDIWSGELNFTIKSSNKTLNWKSHVELTGNHPLLVYRNSTENWERLNASRVYDLWRQGEHLYLSHLWWNYTLRPFEITNVTVRQFCGTVYNLRTTSPEIMFFGKTLTSKERETLEFLKEMGLPIGKFPPFLTISSKLTYYVDWLPVKIVYRTWHDISLWNFTVLTRTWHNIATCIFNLTTMAWHNLATWTFNVITKTWHNIAEWTFQIWTRTWHTITYWTITFTTEIQKKLPFIILIGGIFTVLMTIFMFSKR